MGRLLRSMSLMRAPEVVRPRLDARRHPPSGTTLTSHTSCPSMHFPDQRGDCPLRSTNWLLERSDSTGRSEACRGESTAPPIPDVDSPDDHVDSGPRRPHDPDNLDDLIDAGEVAAILGLAHRNSVSTYRSRYADFPAGRPAPGGGRTRLWTREEILAWHRDFKARKSASEDQPNARLEDLVAATVATLLGSPGQEISIRQIAAEAGVAPLGPLPVHRPPRNNCIDLAIARIERSMQTGHCPPTTRCSATTCPGSWRATHAAAGAMRVLTDRALQGKLGPTSTPACPSTPSRGVLAEHRCRDGPVVLGRPASGGDVHGGDGDGA